MDEVEADFSAESFEQLMLLDPPQWQQQQQQQQQQQHLEDIQQEPNGLFNEVDMDLDQGEEKCLKPAML